MAEHLSGSLWVGGRDVVHHVQHRTPAQAYSIDFFVIGTLTLMDHTAGEGTDVASS
jgi:hypothetical protein